MGSIHNPLSCHRAKQKRKPTKPKNNTQKHTKHRTYNKTELKRIRKDDNIVSPKGLVWQKKNRQTQITKKPYRNL